MAKKTNFTIKVTSNTKGYDQLIVRMKQGIGGFALSSNNPYSVAFRKVAEEYRRFLKNRYNRQKSGGGDWKDISVRTFIWRDRNFGITHRQILYVTRTLYRSVQIKHSPGLGQHQQKIKNGIAVGISPRKKHPASSLNLARLAQVHAETGRVIVVPPNSPTIKKITKVIEYYHRIACKEANKAVKA